jgi:hypothetical protein
MIARMPELTHHRWTVRCLCLLALFALGAARTAAQPSNFLSEKQVGFLENAAKGRYSGRWIEAGSNELRTLRLKAERHDAEIQKHHLVGGLVVSKRYSDINRTRVESYEAVDSSAALTGLYLTAMSYWFSVDVKPQALERIRTSLSGLEKLAEASGRTGYLPAFVGSASDPAFKPAYSTQGGADPARPGFGRLAHSGKAGEVWIGGTGRETYSAVVLGLATVHKRIRDQKIRTRASNLIEQIIGRLDADQWRIDDGHGNQAFIPPMQKAAILRAGASVNPVRHSSKYEAAAKLALEYPTPIPPRYGEARGPILALADLVTLTSLETNETRALGFQSRLTQVWRKSGGDLNPWLAAAYVNAFDHPPNDVLANATLQGVLIQYAEPPRWQQAAPPPASNEVIVEANGRKWFRDARLPNLRPSRPFSWDSPARGTDPGIAENTVHTGVDYLTAFWMARDAGILQHEDAVAEKKPRGRARPTNAVARPVLPLPPNATNRPAGGK